MGQPTNIGSVIGAGWGNNTYIDSSTSQKIPNGSTVTGLQFYSVSPQSVTMKVVKYNSPASVDVVASVPFSHPGGGWATVSTSYTVPSSGDYYVGVFVANSANSPVPLSGQYGSGDISGNNVTVTSAAANFPPVYYVTGQGNPPPPPPPPGGPTPSGTLVIIGAGQSLIACSNGVGAYTVRHTGHLLSMTLAGALVPATDPPADCSGNASTFLVRLGDMILDDGQFQDVVIVPIGVGGSYVSQWAAGGVNNPRIANAFTCLNALGLGSAQKVFLWEQGTQDALTAAVPSVVLANLQSVISTIRSSSSTVPIFIAREGRANGASLGGDAVRAAQLAVCNDVDVLRGPDTDSLGNAFRLPDGIHFKDVHAQALLWKAYIDHYFGVG